MGYIMHLYLTLNCLYFSFAGGMSPAEMQLLWKEVQAAQSQKDPNTVVSMATLSVPSNTAVTVTPSQNKHHKSSAISTTTPSSSSSSSSLPSSLLTLAQSAPPPGPAPGPAVAPGSGPLAGLSPFPGIPNGLVPQDILPLPGTGQNLLTQNKRNCSWLYIARLVDLFVIY